MSSEVEMHDPDAAAPVQSDDKKSEKVNEVENNENTKTKKRKSRRKTGEPKKVAQESVLNTY